MGCSIKCLSQTVSGLIVKQVFALLPLTSRERKYMLKYFTYTWENLIHWSNYFKKSLRGYVHLDNFILVVIFLAEYHYDIS